ncbi:MAG: hypothetical protein ACE5H1_01395, partial [Thermodesulfobacteriota bacterium]
GHDVKSVPQMGWNGLKNGELLTEAQHQFDVFISVDRNLPFQQNLSKFRIAILILKAHSARLSDLKTLVPKIENILPHLESGKAKTIRI